MACVTDRMRTHNLFASQVHKRLAARPLSRTPELGANRNHSEEEILKVGHTSIKEGRRCLDVTTLVRRVEDVLKVIHVVAVVLMERCAEG